MNGTVLNITRFCTDDGPGIRTTVFLKGCPLRCLWCHNPESQAIHPEIMYDAEKCVNCQACLGVCPNGCHSFDAAHTFDRTSCISCGACVSVCPSKSLTLYGKDLSADEVFDEVKRDKIFYDTSGGGVTISGGEPLCQPEFTAEILMRCRREGIHTAIETSGFTDSKSLLSVVKYCDLILFDIKETDDALHKQYTGVSLKQISENLNTINESRIPFIIRAPIIPTINDRKSHFEALKELGKSMSFCKGVQLMPYHRTGSYKYKLLNRPYLCTDIAEPEKEVAEAWESLIQ